MLITTEGIVLTRIKYGDSGVISSIYTKELGLSSFLMQGVRTKKAKTKAILFNPCLHVKMVAYHKENRNLFRIKEIQLAANSQALFSDPRKMAIAQFLAEVFKKTLPENEPDEELFHFLSLCSQSIDSLDAGFPQFIPWVLWKYFRFLGILPSNEWSKQLRFFNIKEGEFVGFENHETLSEEESHALNALMKAETHFNFTARKKELLSNTLSFLIYHVDGFENPKSLEVFQSVFK